VSKLPTKKEIQQVYEHVFAFLDSIPQIVSEAENNDDSGSLSRTSEKIEFEVQALEILANGLVEMHARASISLYSPNRLHRLQVIGENINSSGLLERLRQSNHGTIELVVILGKRLAQWLRCLSGNRHPLTEESDDGRGLDELLKSLPSDLAERVTSAFPSPPTKAQIAQVCKLLEEERAVFVENADDGAEKHKGKKRSPKTELQNNGNSSQKLTRRSQDEMLLAMLRNWHKFDTEEFNFEPVPVAHLIQASKVQAPKAKGLSRSSLYRRFDKLFGGYRQYCEICQREEIREELKALSGEYSPANLRSLLEEHAQATTEHYGLGKEG
jgi:hypothetical protein